jgi:hypothetical protein
MSMERDTDELPPLFLRRAVGLRLFAILSLTYIVIPLNLL